MTGPASEPCDPPLVCIEINQEYIPFIAGAMSQLTQRTSWLATDEDDLQRILANMTWAIEIIGTAVQCDQPPLIPGQPTAQRACNIAGYLAHYIIRESIAQAVQAVQNEQLLLDFVWVVVRFIPGFGAAFPVVTAALPFLFNQVMSLGTADFNSALSDEAFFGAVTCAIYDAIRVDGQVTTANFPTIVSNIRAIPYALTDVRDTVADYVDKLGASGLQAVQVPGAITDYDCTNCATGPALGPIGPAPRQISGKDILQIAVGASDAILPILFPSPFSTPPLLTMGSDNEDVVTSFLNTTTTGTTLRITSAAPALATMSATVDWIADTPGVD